VIALSDVDNASALQLVRTKLHEAGIEIQLSHDDTEMIGWLGGRASDLASVRYASSYPHYPTNLRHLS